MRTLNPGDAVCLSIRVPPACVKSPEVSAPPDGAFLSILWIYLTLAHPSGEEAAESLDKWEAKLWTGPTFCLVDQSQLLLTSSARSQPLNRLQCFSSCQTPPFFHLLLMWKNVTSQLPVSLLLTPWLGKTWPITNHTAHFLIGKGSWLVKRIHRKQGPSVSARAFLELGKTDESFWEHFRAETLSDPSGVRGFITYRRRVNKTSQVSSLYTRSSPCLSFSFFFDHLRPNCTTPNKNHAGRFVFRLMVPKMCDPWTWPLTRKPQ